MKSAVIFGGSGFIGTHLRRELVAQGFDVINADLIPPAVGADLGQYVRCDVRAPIDLHVDAPPTYVFNLAAVHTTPGHEDHEYFDTNVSGASNVTSWCDAVGATTVCFTSSISVYGAREEECDESSALTPNIAYGRSKVLAEEIHSQWLDRSQKHRLVVVRPAVVFGPGENGNFTRLAAAMKKGRFVYPGRKDTIKACGYVNDLIRSMFFAVELDRHYFLYNYAYPMKYSIQDICNAFVEVGGYRSPRSIPRGAMAGLVKALPKVGGGNLAARVGKLTTSTNISPKELIAAGFKWSTDVKTALGDWKVRSLVDGEFA